MMNYYRIVWLDRNSEFHMEAYRTFTDLHFRWNELCETESVVEVLDNTGRLLASKNGGSVYYGTYGKKVA
jgi:hypothetical protein